MSNWGALTDHFGILAIVDGEGTLGDILELKESSKTPVAKSRSVATDENGDIAAATWFGPDGTLYDASSTFILKTGTLDLSLIKLGETTAGTIRASLSVATDNGEWPTIEVTGKLGAETVTAPASKLNTFSLPEIDVLGIKAAQNFGGAAANGFAVAANTKLNSSSLEFSIDIAESTNGLGVPIAHGVSGGVGVLSATIVRITAAPGWTLDTDQWTETAAPGEEEGEAEYHTGTGTAETYIERDDAP